jgi:hypothetical protein
MPITNCALVTKSLLRGFDVLTNSNINQFAKQPQSIFTISLHSSTEPASVRLIIAGSLAQHIATQHGTSSLLMTSHNESTLVIILCSCTQNFIIEFSDATGH